MTAAPDPATNVAVELAQLRGEISTGFESIKGTLAVLIERTNRTDTDVKQLRTDMDKEIGALRAEVEELKNRRFPLPVVGTLTAVGALVATVVGLLLTR